MARTHVSGILLVIVEVLGAEDAILIADQPVRGHLRRVEFDLDLDVLGNRHEGGAHLLHEDLTGFVQPIDKGVIAMPPIGKLHQEGILEIVTETQHRQEDPALRFVFNESHQIVLIGDADVEVSVCRQNDAIHSAVDEVRNGHVIRGLDTGSAIRAALGLETFDHAKDVVFPVAARWLKGNAGRARIRDDAHLVAFRQLIDEHAETALQQRQPFRRAHGTRHVDQKDKITRYLTHRDILRLDPNAHEPVLRAPWRRRHLHVPRDGIWAGSLRVLVAEVVDEFFDTHSIPWRQLIPSQKSPDVCVGRRIDVAGKRGQWLLADCHVRSVRDGVVPEGVARDGRYDAAYGACRLARHISAVCQRGRYFSRRPRRRGRNRPPKRGSRRRRSGLLCSLKDAAEDSAQDAFVPAPISFLCAAALWPLSPLLTLLPSRKSTLWIPIITLLAATLLSLLALLSLLPDLALLAI